MLRLLIIALLTFLVACASSENKNFVVLNYEDFGPQAIASEIIGMEWWQWQTHGDSRPKKYDIKVVVYRNVTLDDAEKMYPINQAENLDYRYVAYENAIKYLEENINQNIMESVTDTLKNTHQKLTGKFN